MGNVNASVVYKVKVQVNELNKYINNKFEKERKKSAISFFLFLLLFKFLFGFVEEIYPYVHKYICITYVCIDVKKLFLA